MEGKDKTAIIFRRDGHLPRRTMIMSKLLELISVQQVCQKDKLTNIIRIFHTNNNQLEKIIKSEMLFTMSKETIKY